MRFIVLFLFGLSLFASVTSLSSSVYGQSFDPRLLEELKQREGARRSTLRTSPLDQSRNSQAEAATGQQLLNDNRLLEPEQSVIEKEFQRRLDNDELVQFGYDIFSSITNGERPVFGRVSDEYILNVGDEIAVTFQGSEQGSTLVRIDSEGRIVLDNLPPVAAAGRQFGEVKAELERRVEEVLLGTEVYLSVGAFNIISVQIVGEVAEPGLYQLTSLSDVVDALGTAGGVRKTGTLRNIKILRGSRSINVDLYDLLTGNGFKGLSLREGDRIIVPPIGGVIAVQGAVIRPAIYELRRSDGDLNLDHALVMAGGLVRPYGNDLTLNRIDKNGREVFSTVDARDLKLRASDAILVATKGGVARGRVRIGGHVVSPGARALDRIVSVRAFIEGYDNIKPGAYLPFAVLERLDPATQSQYLQAVDLLSINGENDIELRSEDELFIFGVQDVEFLGSNEVRRVVLGEQNPIRACRSLDYLEDISGSVQVGRFSSVVTSVFLVENRGEIQAAELSGVQAVASNTVDQDVAAETVGALSSRRQTSGGCPQIFESHPELLPFALEHVVSVSGAIRRPGILPIADTISLQDLIQFSNGLALDADGAIAEVTSLVEEEGQQGRVMRAIMNARYGDFSEVHVKPGNSVRIQSSIDDQELGAVLLGGEFVRPGTYTIRKGETLGDLIERAGGVTEQAYPYGAVFTRQSVKEAQQDGFRRTARELNAALAIAALKNNIDAEAVAAAQQLSTRVSTAEAAGRVVVEADPRVLLLREDLNIILEPGDTLFMPKRPGHVLMIGDVLNPGALQFISGKSVSEYLAEAGGLQSSADDDRIFLVYPNGVAEPVRVSAWRSSNAMVPPGATIVVPKDTDPLAALDLTRDITTIVSQLAISAASLAVIFDRD